jgi:GntR family transcriptional regulator/MocR family aminotransferase
VHVSLVGRKDLTGEIYRQLRRAILDGRLPPGGRLPPTRELARRLNVSRTTVTVAYDRLTGEGFITSRVGAGTFVSDDVLGPAGPARPGRGALRPRPFWDAIAVPTVFDKPARFDFRTGIPDATLFPYQSWRRLLARQLRPAAVGPGAYGDPAGHPGLRQVQATRPQGRHPAQAPAGPRLRGARSAVAVHPHAILNSNAAPRGQGGSPANRRPAENDGASTASSRIPGRRLW